MFGFLSLLTVREARIVDQGPTVELGERLGRHTTIGFSLGNGALRQEEIRDAIDAPVEASGREVRSRSRRSRRWPYR